MAKSKKNSERTTGQFVNPEAILGKISIFQNFHPDELDFVFDIGRQESFNSHANIVIEGEESRGLYVVLRGAVSVHKTDPTTGTLMRLATLDKGAHFGEFSLFDQTPRSATVVAETACKMFVLDVEAFHVFLERFGEELQVRFYKGCAELLAQRFRKLNDDYIHSQQLLWKYALRK